MQGDELMHSNVVYGPYGQVPKLDMFTMMLYIYNLRLNVSYVMLRKHFLYVRSICRPTYLLRIKLILGN